MRKIVPKHLMKLRDPMVVIKDDKILANMAVYTMEGELTRAEYPLPRFNTGAAEVGDYNASASQIYAPFSLMLDNGRTADAYKASGTTVSGKQYATTGYRNHLSLGLDCPFPRIYRQKEGGKAGRQLVRHPGAGYVDITSESLPEAVEGLTVLQHNPTITSTAANPGSPNNNSHYLMNACILDESDSALFHITEGSNIGIGKALASNNYQDRDPPIFWPLQATDLNLTRTLPALTPSSWGFLPVEYVRDRRVLIGWELYAFEGGSRYNNSSYGTQSVRMTPVALRLPAADSLVGTVYGPPLQLDRFYSTTFTLLESALSDYAAGTAGSRTLPLVKSVRHSETSTKMWVPRILSNMQSGPLSNLVSAVTLEFYEYNYVSDTWANHTITPVDVDGGPLYFDEVQMNLDGTTMSAQSRPNGRGIIHYDLSYMHEIDGETYVFVMRVPTGDTARLMPNLVTNTIQYVFKLDAQDQTKATLIHREVIPGFFGMPREGVCSFASNKEQTRLYVIGFEGVYRLKLDSTLKRYVLDDLMYDVNVTSLAVTDNEDLWMVGLDLSLYGLRADNSDIVRVSFAENTGTTFDEAPFDIEVRVSAVNHLGTRDSRSVELVVDGNAVFKANNRNKITVQTSADADVTAIVTVRDFGHIHVTPSKIE